MSIHDRPTIIPETYPALESERWHAIENVHERQTEPPPRPLGFVWLSPPALRPTLVELPWGLK